jgi:hypothetical protein
MPSTSPLALILLLVACRNDPATGAAGSDVPSDAVLDPSCLDATDADGDGFPAVVCGGTDCDDADPTAHPGVTDGVFRWEPLAWGAPASASAGSVTGNRPPDALAVGPDGTAYVLDLADDGTLMLGTRDADGWTTEAVPLPAPAAFGVPSALAVTADGAVHLLVESYGDLFAVHRKAGAWTYELLEPLPGPCCTSGTARLAVDPDGSLWAAVLRVFPTPGLFLYHQGASGWSSEDTAALRVTDPTYELALDIGPDGGLWLLRAEWSNGSRLDSLPRVAHWTAEGWTDAPVPGGPRQFTHVGAGMQAFDGEVAIAVQDADGIQWITTDGAQIQAQQLPGPGGTPRLAVSGTPSSPGVAYLTERQPDGSTIAVGQVDRAGTVEIPVDLAAINGGYPRPFLVDDAGVLHAITEYASSGTEPHRYLAVQFPDGVDQDCDGRPDGRSGLTPTQPTADLDAAQIDQLCGWAATLADDAPAPDSCWPAVDEATCPARVVMCPTVETFEQCQLAVAAGQCDAPDGLGACAPCVSPVAEHRATDDLTPDEADAVCDWAAALDPDTDRCPLPAGRRWRQLRRAAPDVPHRRDLRRLPARDGPARLRRGRHARGVRQLHPRPRSAAWNVGG